MSAVKKVSKDYVTRVLASALDVDARLWNELLAMQPEASPFMRHEYLAAMETSGSATPQTGWGPRFITLWQGDQLHAACALYLKSHSWGEYVFDWVWANAYEQNGVDYYPKAVVAAPFTPAPGARLLARDDTARTALIHAIVALAKSLRLSSAHLLFMSDGDAAACEANGLMLRHTVQFHWTQGGWASFDEFLMSLSQDKRKKIRQERRKVADAGVTFRWARGADIQPADWDYFYRCYERTYREHGNAPYLSREFFTAMARDMPDHWLLFIAELGGRRAASSLIALDGTVAYGRYWGATQRVDCLHFEACYYQPLQWCIEHGMTRFEGGAQGEHKMARALMPVKTTSAHWLAHPAFASAVADFLERESRGIDARVEQLEARSPFRQV